MAGTIRVIAGSLKGRRLVTPSWDGLRPTADRLRETLFNVLAGDIEGARVMDGFAGTGALGIEALSRGASHVTFVERDRRAVELIEENLTRCGVNGGYSIIRAPFEGAAPRLDDAAFDLVLLDPPYLDVDPVRVLETAAHLVAQNGRVVLEHARRRATPERAGGLVRVRDLIAGDSGLAIYRREHEP